MNDLFYRDAKGRVIQCRMMEFTVDVFDFDTEKGVYEMRMDKLSFIDAFNHYKDPSDTSCLFGGQTTVEFFSDTYLTQREFVLIRDDDGIIFVGEEAAKKDISDRLEGLGVFNYGNHGWLMNNGLIEFHPIKCSIDMLSDSALSIERDRPIFDTFTECFSYYNNKRMFLFDEPF